MKPWLGITWGISNRFGWGIYGINLVRELLKRPSPAPVCFGQFAIETFTEELLHELQPAIEFQTRNLQHFHKAGQVAHLGNSVVLHALGNGMEWSLISQGVEGDANVGVIFFEYTEISPAGRARLGKLNGTIAGSSWNAEVLKGWGVENVRTVLQGVDLDRFQPQPRQGEYGDRFVVFSGGKLDFRKGQDIVLKAFKTFSERHEDAVLVTAWQNLWPLTALPMHYSKNADTLPDVRADGTLNLEKWAAEHGVRPDAFVDVGMRGNEDMPALLAECDLAVFPNRCEGGTNLVAMEAMACGVPCIIANNTGQKDLIGDANCYPVETPDPVSNTPLATDGWGECSVEALLEEMERAYQNREQTAHVGRAGTDFMHSWSWPAQISQLLDTVDELTE